MREYNTAPASKVRDGKLSTKLETSLETDTVTEVELAKLVGSAGLIGIIAKLVKLELELECITAWDKAYGKPKWTDALRLSGSRW